MRKKCWLKGWLNRLSKIANNFKAILRLQQDKEKPLYPLKVDLIKVNDAKKVDALSDSDQYKLLKFLKNILTELMIKDVSSLLYFLNTGMRYGELIVSNGWI